MLHSLGSTDVVGRYHPSCNGMTQEHYSQGQNRTRPQRRGPSHHFRFVSAVALAVASPERALILAPSSSRCVLDFSITTKSSTTNMDRQSVYTLSLFGEERSANGGESNKQLHQDLVDFILEFHLENVFIYRYA